MVECPSEVEPVGMAAAPGTKALGITVALLPNGGSEAWITVLANAVLPHSRLVGPDIDLIAIGAVALAQASGHVGDVATARGTHQELGRVDRACRHDQGLGRDDLVLQHGAGLVGTVHVKGPLAIGRLDDARHVVLGLHRHVARGQGLVQVGHIDRELAAVVHTQRAVAVGVRGRHLTAQLGQGIVPVNRHADLGQLKACGLHSAGKEACCLVSGAVDELVGCRLQVQHL